jgi:hypothetical protein
LGWRRIIIRDDESRFGRLAAGDIDPVHESLRDPAKDFDASRAGGGLKCRRASASPG